MKIKYWLVMGLLLISVWLYGNNQRLTDQRNKLMVELGQAQDTLLYWQQEHDRINEINQASYRYIQQLIAQSNQIRVSIKEAIKNETCAAIPIPDDVVDQLRSHADRIGTTDDSQSFN